MHLPQKSAKAMGFSAAQQAFFLIFFFYLQGNFLQDLSVILLQLLPMPLITFPTLVFCHYHWISYGRTKTRFIYSFGHGRIEYVSGLIVSGAISIMAFELVKTSAQKILHPEPVDFQPLADQAFWRYPFYCAASRWPATTAPQAKKLILPP